LDLFLKTVQSSKWCLELRQTALEFLPDLATPFQHIGKRAKHQSDNDGQNDGC
jgi:hypothetical protein